MAASPTPSDRSPTPPLIALPEAVAPPAAQLPPPALPRYLDHHAAAPVHPIPLAPLLSVEYPGFIQPSPAALQRALFTLGGPTRLDSLLELQAPEAAADSKAPAGNSASLPVVELNYSRTSDAPDVADAARWKHPVLGQVIDGDKLVLRVRKRRKVRVDRETGARERLDAGEFTMDVLGPVASTVRFRNIADHQYQPPTDTPTATYLRAMRSLDHGFLLNEPFPVETEEYTAPLTPADDGGGMDVDGEGDEAESSFQARDRRMRSTAGLFPPPMFSMQRVPWKYNYKPNPYSSLVALANPGEGEQQRLSNRSKNKIIGVGMVKFQPGVIVPSEPPAGWQAKAQDADFMTRLHKLFADPGTYAHEGIESRPVWSRMALANQFAEGESGVRHRIKLELPGVAYTFEGGAYRDLMIRLGYDPREDPDAGPSYQGARLRALNSASGIERVKRSFMGSHNVRHYASSFASQKAADVLPGGDVRKTHLFDGLKLHRDWQNFQLCDISEPELADLIADRDGQREVCFGEDGWYKPVRYTLIREILRRKFNSLISTGSPLAAGACDELKAAAELEQARADGGALDAELKSGDDDEPGWADDLSSADDHGKGKGRPRASTSAAPDKKGKGVGGRKVKRKTLNSLIHPNAKKSTRGKTRARQVGVTDAVEMAERLQRDLERDERLTAAGVI